MAGPFKLSGPSAAPAAGGPPRELVVLLHGVGADGNDLIGLAGEWRRQMPHAAFVSPNAPFPCDMAPYGYQWFSLQDRSPERMLAGIRATAPILTGFLEEQLAAYGLGWSRLVLVGFSQGTMMSLYVAPRLPQPIAGVVGYSGALLGPELLAAETVCRPPMLLVHGDADQIVPWQATQMAAQALQAAGFPVEHAIRPRLAHGIDPEGIRLGGAFMLRQLAP